MSSPATEPSATPPVDRAGLPAETLSPELLRAMAGARSFQRGENYFALGCIEKLGIEGEIAPAIVQGTQRYRVELRPTAAEQGIEYSCDCPVGREGSFCKHCVATGLALIAAGSEVPIELEPMSVAEVEQRLVGLDREQLLELMMAEVGGDEDLLERLRLRFAVGPTGSISRVSAARSTSLATRRVGSIPMSGVAGSRR